MDMSKKEKQEKFPSPVHHCKGEDCKSTQFRTVEKANGVRVRVKCRACGKEAYCKGHEPPEVAPEIVDVVAEEVTGEV